MKYRHEWKHEINRFDCMILRTRLSAVMKHDSHAIDGKYKIRSLYFDTPEDKALREKIDGVNIRDKYRLRYYNGDCSTIFLEKKSKINGLCAKTGCLITADEAQKIIDGKADLINAESRPLITELCFKMKAERLGPKTIVDYTREPFIFPAGNVRVTIDYDIRTGLFNTDFINPNTVTMPAGDSPIILEVKWDEFLPDIIKDAVFINGRRASAFSKYAQCRIYD